jgi:hypothetical protein
MPEISRFFGIVIRMFFDDHHPPHLHADYAGQGARIGLTPLTVLESQLPARALAMVLEWTALHQQELLDNWDRLHAGQPPVKVPPLS